MDGGAALVVDCDSAKAGLRKAMAPRHGLAIDAQTLFFVSKIRICKTRPWKNMTSSVLGPAGESGKVHRLNSKRRRECERSLLSEKNYIGGSCPNIACLPSKTISHSGEK